jgi:hypothetical protein
VASEANAKPVTLFSIVRSGQSYVCADLNDARATTTDTVGSWILGVWSGMNIAFSANVGQSTTSTGILGEVKFYCVSHPSLDLANAINNTYLKMRAAHR